MIVCRGVRGATCVAEDTPEAILAATRRLLALMVRLNGIEPRDVASVLFTTTPDLRSEFPALAARQLGWRDVALLCAHEMAVPGALARVVRILIHWNTARAADQLAHVYIQGAERLRPDRRALPPVDFAELDRWIDDAIARLESDA